MSEFKKCSSCGKSWSSLEDFLNDENLIVNGYQPNYESVHNGYLMFTHIIPSCKSSILVPVTSFSSIYKKEYEEVRMGTYDECPDYCEHGDSLDLCKVPVCEGYFVRELIHFLRHREKK